MNKNLMVGGAALALALVFGGGAYFYKAQQAQEVNQAVGADESPLYRPASVSLGVQDAKVVIVEFFDPACESCRRMYPYVKSLMRANEGKLRLSVRYAAFHKGSDYVVKVLEASRLQGDALYWKSLEAILANQSIWADHEQPDPRKVWDYLGATGLDVEKARKDMDDPRIDALLRQDTKDLEALKVNKTPSFFINGKPLAEFGQNGLRAQVEKEIKIAYP